MKNKIYRGSNYKSIMNEIAKDYPKGYKIVNEKETVKNKFLFWMKDYEVEIDDVEVKKEKKERSKKILDILDDKNTASEKEMMDRLLREGEEIEGLQRVETTKDVIDKIKKQVQIENEMKEKEKEEIIKQRKEEIVEELQEMDIDKKIAQALVSMLSEKETENEGYMGVISEKMKKMIRVTNGFDFKKANVIALIGPTGVGKTTTIAKLAGAMVHKGYRVGMVTTDVYRVGAIAQLKIYADILETEIHIAKSKEELENKIEEMKKNGVEKILIDTVGRSPLDTGAIDDITEYLEIANPDYTSLVLSATQKTADIDKIIKNFDKTKIDSLIFTKLDETTTHGIILNTANKSGLPISYITNGQDVPNAIYVADADEIVEKIVNGVENFGSSVFTS